MQDDIAALQTLECEKRARFYCDYQVRRWWGRM